MRFPTADNRERKVLKIDHFLGMDFSNSPMRAESYHSVDGQNFIYRNGVNSKRNGWEEKLRLPDRLNGMWDFISNGEHHIIAQAGKRFFRIYQDYTHIEIPVDTTKINDDRSFGFVYQDKLWILCGDFIAYGNWGEWGIRRVEDFAYVPTTSTNIDNDLVDDIARASLEQVNLLSKWRKNEMVGTTIGATFTVDSGQIDENSDVTVELYIKTDGDPLFKTYTNSIDKNKLYEDETEVGTIDFLNGKITFLNSTEPPISGESNITVTFSYTSEGYADRVNQSTIGILFGVAGNTDRLFTAGNPNYKNRVFWSEKEDFTYFPDLNFADTGNSTVEIMGFSRLGDGTLAVHKKNNWQDASIYLIEGKWQETDGIYLPVFTVRAGAIGETMYTKYGNATLNNDCLIVSQSGVYGIELAENVATNERYAKERSKLINGKLLTHTGLNEAVGVVFDQKYFLAVDDVCYVADGRFFNGNYEWWYWVNMPVRVWSVIGDELWFGSYDGRVCVIGNNFVDLSYQTSEAGDLAIDYADNKVIINSALWDDVVNNDYVVFNSDVFRLLTDDIEIVGEFLKTNETDILTLYEELKVRVDNTIGLNIATEYTVRNVDYGQCTFELYDGETKIVPLENTFRILQNLKGINTIVTNAEGLEFQLNRGEQLIKLTQFNGVGSEDTIAKFEFRRNVVAYWYTPVFDMGTNIYSKTLYGMTIATEPRTNGQLQFGYKTWKGEPTLKQVRGVGLFSFDDLDFNNFSFNTEAFPTSYTIKVKERNVNYTMLKFYSDNDKDCAVNNMSVIYSINRYNRGVR